MNSATSVLRGRMLEGKQAGHSGAPGSVPSYDKSFAGPSSSFRGLNGDCRFLPRRQTGGERAREGQGKGINYRIVFFSIQSISHDPDIEWFPIGWAGRPNS